MLNLSVHKLVHKWTATLVAFAFLLGTLGVQTAHAVSPGTVVAWGYGGNGQTSVPDGLSDVVAIDAGYYHNLALKSDGTVVAWGQNTSGQTDVPYWLSNVTAISAGYQHSLALQADGTVVAWGNDCCAQGRVPDGLGDVIAIAAGGYHNLALRSDGTVVGWGENFYGQSNAPAGLSDVIAISAGNTHSLALKSDGTVVAWGWDKYGQTDVPAGLSDVVAISAGYLHSLALKSDGTVVAWGWNEYGQTNVPAGLSGVIDIATGDYHSLALRNDGTVVAWGDNCCGQGSAPAGLGRMTTIAAGSYHNLGIVSEAADTTPPAITINTPADGAQYLLGQNVNADYACQDEANGSGLASCVGTVANGSPIDTSSFGSKSFTVNTTDNAGNPASLTYHYSVVDSTAPTVTITTPTNGAVFTLGQVVNANYACQDEVNGSGLASCAGTVASGSPIDTASVGGKSFTVNATDNAGNPASLTHGYSVIYNFSGFLQPVDNLPTLNVVAAGKGIPVKFSLRGNQGLNVLAAGFPTSQKIACSGGAAVDDVEQTLTVGNSSLSYDAATDTYTYGWKTEKAWAGTCRQLTIKLNDGTEHLANFKFK